MEVPPNTALRVKTKMAKGGKTWPLMLAGVFFLGSEIAGETKDLVRLAWQVKNAILREDFI